MAGRQVAGRVRVAPLLLGAILLVIAFCVGRRLSNPEPGSRASGVSDASSSTSTPRASSVEGFEGSVEHEGGRLRARLAPFHVDPGERVQAEAKLWERFGLPPSPLWRLVLDFEGPPEARLRIDRVEVLDAQGVAQAPIEELLLRARPEDPLARLFGQGGLTLASGLSVQRALSGRAPSEGPRAALELDDGERLELPLEPRTHAAESLPRSFRILGSGATGAAGGNGSARTTAPGGDPRDLEIARLEEELRRARLERREREAEWLDYNRAIAALDIEAIVGSFRVEPEGKEVPAPTEEPGGDPLAQERALRGRRAESIHTSLAALLALEEVRGYDLFEVGELGSGWIGPVVFRLLDDRGRLAGHLFAERLRLEGSRAAKTVALVLEEGRESRGGVDTPFENGVRRIELPFADPERWVESAPELFGSSELEPVEDDGSHDLDLLRSELNRLLARDTSAGWYRVKALGGVLGDALCDVHLEELDGSGRIQRRIFADRARICEEPPGVLVLLESGAVLLGDQKYAFSGGVYRLFLPRARIEDWRAAGVPGLSASQGPRER